MDNIFTTAIRTDVAAQEQVRAWITALRSGEYEQGRNLLRTNNSGYCCLGVACDVYDSSRWKFEPVSDMWVYTIPGRSEHSGSGLPFDIRDAYCLVDGSGLFVDEETGIEDVDADTLAWFNDSQDESHRDFSQIADIIEENLQKRLEE